MTPQESDLVLCIIGGCLCLGSLLLFGIELLDQRFPRFFDRIDQALFGREPEWVEAEDARS